MRTTTNTIILSALLFSAAAASHAAGFDIKPACEVPPSTTPTVVIQSGDSDAPIYDTPFETGDRHWEQERALADHDREMATLEQQALNKGLPDQTFRIKENIVSAKLHVAYAATAQLTKDDPQQAANELNTAAQLLSDALKLAGPKGNAEIKIAMDQVNNTEKQVIPCHGQSKWQEGYAYEHLESMLKHMIKSKLITS